MEDINRALVAKLGWNLARGKDCLWVLALQAKYCRGARFLNVTATQGASWIWRSIMQTRDLVIAGFSWGGRDGRRINLWCDPWVPTLDGYTPQLRPGALVDRRINFVRDLINADTNTRKKNLICSLFDEESATAILQIKLPSQRPPDLPRWLLSSKGTYSVKEAYLYDQKGRMVDTGVLTSPEWTKIWRLKIQHRLKLLVWKVAANALPIRRFLPVVQFARYAKLWRNLQNISFWDARLVFQYGVKALGL